MSRLDQCSQTPTYVNLKGKITELVSIRSQTWVKNERLTIIASWSSHIISVGGVYIRIIDTSKNNNMLYDNMLRFFGKTIEKTILF